MPSSRQSEVGYSRPDSHLFAQLCGRLILLSWTFVLRSSTKSACWCMALSDHEKSPHEQERGRGCEAG